MDELMTFCLECGQHIGFGRPDRKFCSLRCKNRYHNKQRCMDWHAEQDRILRILSRNHDILERLLMMGLPSMDRITLGQMGYNENYVTSFHKVGTHCLCSCFDIQYEKTPSRIIHLESPVNYTGRRRKRKGEDP